MFEFGAESDEERDFQDATATATIECLADLGVLQSGPPFSAAAFHLYHAQVRERCCIPETSITMLMARVLYGIADRARPRRILGVGVGSGSALVWVAGPILGRAHIIGVDVDLAAVSLARQNFRAFDLDEGTFLHLDGHRIPEIVPGPYDLILLDADDHALRKRVYRSLLEALAAQLTPGALILAHDVCYPAFSPDLAAYQSLVKDISRFRASVTLDIDPFGLEVTVR